MSDNLEIVKQEPSAVALRDTAPSVAQMLHAVIEKGVSQENVAALDKLVGLYERMQDRDAVKAFNAAFVALQADLPIIEATSVIPNRGKYEKFEHLMIVVGPLLTKHGFSVSFANDYKENRIIETCTLRHSSGHFQTNSFAVRVGKADSETQSDCKAATTAKRNALMNALNIVITQDCLNSEDDPRNEGEFISKQQADELERRVKMTHSNEVAFLKFAGAATYAEISSGKHAVLDEFLSKKEKRTA